MFSVGERVMHPGQGLCTIVGFRDTPSPALILEAGSGRNATRLLYPADQAEAHLHPPVSRAEALDVIENYDSIACDTHSDRNSGQEEAYFKALLKRGVPDSVRVVKTMRTRIAQCERSARKPSAYIARVLKEARLRSLEELACALDTTPDVVEQMFRDRGAGIADDSAQ